MSATNGKRVVCDRCYAETFCKHTGTAETDGGYTRWNTFEEMPAGWEYIGNNIKGVQHLCPKCAEEWEHAKNVFMGRTADEQN